MSEHGNAIALFDDEQQDNDSGDDGQPDSVMSACDNDEHNEN